MVDYKPSVTDLEERRIARETALTQITSQLDKAPDFSQIQFIVRKHRGKLAKVETMVSTPHSFNREEANVEAATMVYQLMDSAIKANAEGALSFTMVLKKGENKGRFANIQVQDFKKL